MSVGVKALSVEVGRGGGGRSSARGEATTAVGVGAGLTQGVVRLRLGCEGRELAKRLRQRPLQAIGVNVEERRRSEAAKAARHCALQIVVVESDRNEFGERSKSGREAR